MYVLGEIDKKIFYIVKLLKYFINIGHGIIFRGLHLKRKLF